MSEQLGTDRVARRRARGTRAGRRGLAAVFVCGLPLLVVGPRAAARPPQLSRQQIQVLIDQLREGPVGARDRAAQRLYLLQDPRAHREVLALARDPSPAVRAVGVWALSVVRPPGAQQLLRSALRDGEGAVRRAAVVAVSALRPAAGLKWLGPLLRDRDRGVRVAAVRSVARLGGDRAVQLLLATARRGRDDEVRLLAVAGLGRTPGVRALRALVQLASGGAGELVQLQAARELLASTRAKPSPGQGTRGADGAKRAAARALCRLLRHGQEVGSRLQAAQALTEDRSVAGERCLRRALRQADAGVKQAAWAALAERRARR